MELTGDDDDDAQSGASTLALGKTQERSGVQAPAALQGATPVGSQPAPGANVSAVAAKWMAMQAATQMAQETATQKQTTTIKQEGQGMQEEGEEDEAQERDGASMDAQRHADVRKYGERPDDWIDKWSLVFVLFGRPAGEQEDVDLKLKMSGGGQTGAAATAAVGKGSGVLGSAAKAHGLGRHDLTNLDGAGGGAGGQQSRASVKKEQHAANSEAKRSEEAKATAKFRAEALKVMAAPAETSETTTRLVDSVENLSRAVMKRQSLDEEVADRERWTFLKKVKKEHWETLVNLGLGKTPEGEAAQKDLLEILGNPPGAKTL